MAPWEILANATSFLSFMSGYTSFLGPIVGILIADFWIVRQGRIDVPSLYLGRDGRYFYTAGVNWRALITLLLTVTPTLPGLANAINPKIAISQGMKNLYAVVRLPLLPQVHSPQPADARTQRRQTWLFSFTAAGLVYTVLSLAFKDRESHIPKAIYAHHEGASPVTHDDVEQAVPADSGDASSEKEKDAALVGVHGVL
jgi:NCS1 family nucleobase:cation symporter-1